MRHPLIASAFSFAALTIAILAPDLGFAQAQPQLPGLKPPPMAPIKPYKPVAVTPPQPFGDASFVAFRKTLGDIAGHKDRAALAKLVVAKGFFWIQDKDYADNRKSGIDNFAKAIGLDAKDGSGWDVLTGFAGEPTASELSDHKGVICAPADPTINPQDFDALGKETQTDPTDWGYPTKAGIEVRAAAKPNAPVIETLGLYLVRVLPDSAAPENPNEPSFLHVATPSGKAGYVLAETLVPLGGDQMCYAKDTGGWKIAGYFGGVSP
jgi:hypothetical protein